MMQETEVFRVQDVRHPWRALYWEPVAGTGERLMVGVVYHFQEEFGAVRTIRDDVLTSLFGKAASSLFSLIDHGMSIYKVAARETSSIEQIEFPISGLVPGPLRATAANSITDLLNTACLLYSSLGNLDKLDEPEDSDAPQQEEVNLRFGSEVKDIVAQSRPNLIPNFGRGGQLITGGQSVKFGFLSEKVVLHFTVLHPVKHSSSMRDARARIFELQRAREVGSIAGAALIAAVPRDDDVTLGAKQRVRLRENRIEIEAEADSVNLRWFAVNTAKEGAARVIEIAA